MNRNPRFLASILALLLALAPAAAAQGGLTSELTLLASRYDVGEEIPVHVLLHNAGPGDAEVVGSLYSLMTHAVRVTLVDRSTGDDVDEMLHWCGPGQLGRPAKLVPGAWIPQRFDLGEIYPLLPAGAYRLTIECRSGEEWVRAWPVDFEVREPSRIEADRLQAFAAIQKMDVGPERKLALERFLDGNNASHLGFAAARELVYSYYQAGDLDRALQLMSGLLQAGLSEPRTSMVRWNHARVLHERGFRHDAIRHLAVLPDLDAENLLATF